MKICDDDHDEVCFEGRNCPVCNLISDHKQEAEKLEDQIKDLESTITDLKQEIQDLQSQAQ